MLCRCLIFLLLPLAVSAQDPVPLVRSFSIAYENDLLTAAIDTPTDYYYTGGTFIEFKIPLLEKSPTSKLLLKLPNGHDESFGLSYNNLAFTATSIEADSILIGDRPFSGTLYLGLDRVSVNSNKQMRMTSRLDVGVIGPAALGYQTQKFIHARTNNPEPHGWQFQVANDLYLNYSLRLEKGLLAKNNVLDVIGYGIVNAGTIYSNAGAGLRIRTGRMQSYFNSPVYADRFEFWAYADGACKVIGRDATLQGGLLGRNSIYAIDASAMNRAVFLLNAGVVIAYHNFRAEYSNAFLTPEFSTGRKHSWGHLGFTILF